MDWKQIEPWEYIIVAVATEYHKKFNIVEYDDIKQALYQWFPEHPNKLYRSGSVFIYVTLASEIRMTDYAIHSVSFLMKTIVRKQVAQESNHQQPNRHTHCKPDDLEVS